MRFAQTLIVSSFVLLSSTMLADVVLAESREPRAFAFSCTVPSFGKERCGDANVNIRVKKDQQLVVMLKNLPKGTQAKPICVEFVTYHAVTGDELEKSSPVCENVKVGTLWTNRKGQDVDVFAKVGSNIVSSFVLEGNYVTQY